MYERPAKEDDDVRLLSARLQSLHDDVSDIKTGMRDLAAAITKLALIEERVANTNSAQERAFMALAKLESRITALEQKAPTNDASAKWVDRFVFGIVGVFLMFVWDKLKSGN